ncbi:MAG: serine O-acetyltransferase [Candidatus Sericytochromatia bacterium]
MNVPTNAQNATEPQSEIQDSPLSSSITGSPSSLQQLIQNFHQAHAPLRVVSSLKAQHWIHSLLGLLFPHLSVFPGKPVDILRQSQELETELTTLLEVVAGDLTLAPSELAQAYFSEDLPQIYLTLQQDGRCMLAGDPAAVSLDEVYQTYPGFLAVAIYRLAHGLHLRQIPLLPRLLTEYSHRLTGVDIHPGAKIGPSLCIDHGTGIVIGETSEIGACVKLYQGVTLGALSVEKNMAQTKRHPSIQDRVVIYAGATILGGETVIGHDSVIGGNVWLTRSIEPFSRVYQTSEVRVQRKAE